MTVVETRPEHVEAVTLVAAPGECDTRVVVDLPARRLVVQAEPVTAIEALAAAEDGCYTAVLEAPLHALAHAVSSPQTWNRWLARALVVNGLAFGVRHRIVAIDERGENIYVEASIDVLAMLAH